MSILADKVKRGLEDMYGTSHGSMMDVAVAEFISHPKFKFTTYNSKLDKWRGQIPGTDRVIIGLVFHDTKEIIESYIDMSTHRALQGKAGVMS